MKEILCIVCPKGCKMQAEAPDRITGYGCKRGEAFALAEMTNPMRTLTTTVKTSFPGVPVLPVRTNGAIPKGKIFDAMRALNGVVVDKALRIGDTVVENILGLGVNVIATSGALHE